MAVHDTFPPPPTHLDAADIAHELSQLRERQRLLERRGRQFTTIASRGFWVLIAAAGIAFAYAMATGNGDAMAKAFLVLLIIAIIGAAAWILPHDGDWGHSELGYPFRSENELLERAIAIRENWLKILNRHA